MSAPARLNNVTLYVRREDLDTVADFYTKILGGAVLFVHPGHIRCLDAGPERSVCVHAEEGDDRPGDVEIIFWVDDPASLKARLTDAGTQLLTLQVG